MISHIHIKNTTTTRSFGTMAPSKSFDDDPSAEILALLRQGENSSVEFKSANAHPDSLARELVAFANTQGGTLLIGVEDDGSISGLTESLDHEARIAHIARHHVHPPLTIESTAVTMPEGRILMVEVARGRDRPYQTLQNPFLVRVGSTNRTATQTGTDRTLGWTEREYGFQATPPMKMPNDKP